MSAHSSGPWYGGVSDIGRVRAVNEDALLMEPPLFAVADGLGGHEAGEVASELAVEVLYENAPRRADAKALARAVRSANDAVIEAAESGRGRAGMGTTLTAAMLEGSRVVVAHVGDSRAYLQREGTIRQVTRDHSLVAEMVRDGELTAEESRHHSLRSVVTRALGSDPNMLADTFEFDAVPGDRLLLCSDGLTSMLYDDAIGDILARHADPGAAARALADAANDAGGQDNITVVVVDITGEPGHAADAPSSPEASRRWISRGLWLLAAIAIVTAGVWGTVAYARSEAFVTEENGVLVVYRGLPGSFAGVELKWKDWETMVPAYPLGERRLARLREGVRVEDVEAAYRLVDEYRLELIERGLDPTMTPIPPF